MCFVLFCVLFFFFFKQKTAYEIMPSLVGSEMCIRDRAYCELADLDAAEYDEERSGLWTRGLLIRRNIADGDFAFFSTWCPFGTSIETLVMIEGHRWAIEDSFETVSYTHLRAHETRHDLV